MKTKIFYDFEATSVARDADMVSVGLVAVTEKFVSQTRTVSIEQIKNFEWEVLHCFNKQEEQKVKGLLESNGISYKQGWTNKENSEECFFVFNDCLPTYNDIVKVREIFRLNQEVKTFYAEFTDFNIDKCDDWVKENVVGKLQLKDRFDNWDGSISLFEHYKISDSFVIKAETNAVSRYLKDWLSQFEEIEFWADFDVIDKPMLVDLIADWYIKRDDSLENSVYEHCKEIVINLDLKNQEIVTRIFIENYPIKTIYRKFNKIGLPEHLPSIKYDQFFDLHTLFKIKGIDTDISREEYSEVRSQIIPLPFSNYDKFHNALWDAYIGYLCYEKLML